VSLALALYEIPHSSGLCLIRLCRKFVTDRTQLGRRREIETPIGRAITAACQSTKVYGADHLCSPTSPSPTLFDGSRSGRHARLPLAELPRQLVLPPVHRRAPHPVQAPRLHRGIAGPRTPPRPTRRSPLDAHLQAEAAAIKWGLRGLPDAIFDHLEAERETPPPDAQLNLEDVLGSAPAAAGQGASGAAALMAEIAKLATRGR
jgi:hypothetical protein